MEAPEPSDIEVRARVAPSLPDAPVAYVVAALIRHYRFGGEVYLYYASVDRLPAGLGPERHVAQAVPPRELHFGPVVSLAVHAAPYVVDSLVEPVGLLEQCSEILGLAIYYACEPAAGSVVNDERPLLTVLILNIDPEVGHEIQHLSSVELTYPGEPFR